VWKEWSNLRRKRGKADAHGQYALTICRQRQVAVCETCTMRSRKFMELPRATDLLAWLSGWLTLRSRSCSTMLEGASRTRRKRCASRHLLHVLIVATSRKQCGQSPSLLPLIIPRRLNLRLARLRNGYVPELSRTTLPW
jgi:hypothetical protein